MSEMISFGAGINSVAMTIMLVEQGWRGPVVFADTGGEHPDTYCYLRYFEDNWLKSRGLEITRLSPWVTPGLYNGKRIGKGGDYDGAESLEDFCIREHIIPLLSVRWCSVQFKRTPLENWRKRQGIDVTCIGIAAEETRRVHADDPAVRYPLVDEGIHRGECRRIIERAGLLVPRKSGCFFCPGQPLAQWRLLYYEYPELYERAARLEEVASEKCQKWATLDPHGQSLRQMLEHRWQGQIEMDLSDWLPCACRL